VEIQFLEFVSPKLDESIMTCKHENIILLEKLLD
jgi:hypothetical protein